MDHGIDMLDDLRAGQVNLTLYRQLGQYSVSIYPEHLRKLLDAGAVEPVDESSYILTDRTLYDRSIGLSLDVETGNGIFI